MNNHLPGQRFVRLSLTCALMIVMTAWLQTTHAGDGGEPPLIRAEQRVIHEAQQAMAAKRYAEAQKKLSDYIQQRGGKIHYQVEFTLGNAWMLDGRPVQALPHYRAAADRHGSDAAVWQNLGKACYELKQFGEAGDCLAKAHTLTAPPTPTLAYQAAVAYLQARRPGDARSLLERIVAEADGKANAEWLEALLKVYLDLGQKDKALDLTRTLVGGQGQDPRVWQVLTRLYIDCKAYAKAAAAMEIQTSLAEANREEIELLGDLYRMAGVPLKAARQYEKLLTAAAHPKDVVKAASAYLAARRTDTAIDVLKREVDRHPTPRLWWMLAGAQYEREDFDKALEAFEQCTHGDFRDGEAHLMMGYCALRLDRLPAAKAAFTQAVRFPRQRAEAAQRLKEIGHHHLAASPSDRSDDI